MNLLGPLTGFQPRKAGLSLALAFGAAPLAAQEPVAPAPVAAAPAGEVAPAAAQETAAQAGDGSTATPAPGADAGSYTPMKPVPGVGQPVPAGLDVQDQFSPIGHYARGLHTGLIWVMAIISAFVLALLLYTMFRFRRSANPTPSRTSHNTLIEVIWTVVPALILLGIAVPSITLLAKQYQSPPKDALTIKVTGYQWYWGYTYPDNGEFEVISNMLSKEDAEKAGEPHQLAVDNRMVVPAGVPLRIQVTAADVIHSFAVPSLWFKLDAVPGRLNEKQLIIEKPGVYYGQCSELCGARHGYMPIAVEALPMDKYNAWVLAQGGTVKGAQPAAAPAAAPLQQPESAVPGAAGAGAPPVAATAAPAR